MGASCESHISFPPTLGPSALPHCPSTKVRWYFLGTDAYFSRWPLATRWTGQTKAHQVVEFVSVWRWGQSTGRTTCGIRASLFVDSFSPLMLFLLRCSVSLFFHIGRVTFSALLFANPAGKHQNLFACITKLTKRNKWLRRRYGELED